MQKRRAVLTGALALVLAGCAVLAQSDHNAGAGPDPIIQLLDRSITEITKGISETSTSPNKSGQEKVISLLRKQQEQLDAIKSKQGQADINGPGQVPNNLDNFLRTGDELRKALKELQPTHEVSTAQYSPDPSYCANHCERTCGYNSVGEKVCWYVCYRCCSNGGC